MHVELKFGVHDRSLPAQRRAPYAAYSVYHGYDRTKLNYTAGFLNLWYMAP